MTLDNVQQALGLEQNITGILRNIRKRRIRHVFTTFHIPKQSENYYFHKEEALRDGIPEIVYEAAIQFAVEYSTFVCDLHDYNRDRFEEVIRHYRFLEEQEKDQEDTYLHSHSRNFDENISIWTILGCNPNHTRQVKFCRKLAAEHGVASIDYKCKARYWEKKRDFFNATFQRLPEFKCPEQLIADEQIRAQALDANIGFSLDYRNVLQDSVCAAKGKFGWVRGGVFERLVAMHYEPAKEYKTQEVLDRLYGAGI